MTKPLPLEIGDWVTVINYRGGIPRNITTIRVIAIGEWGKTKDNITLEGGWLAKRSRLRKLPDRRAK